MRRFYLLIVSLFNNTKTRFAVSLEEYLFENTPVTEMLESSKKIHACLLLLSVGICVACLKLTTLPKVRPT